VASLRESSKIFYYVHFIEYAIFNKSKKDSFYFGAGERWIIVCKINCNEQFDFIKAIERLAVAILHNG
jgi:hypothetical protein